MKNLILIALVLCSAYGFSNTTGNNLLKKEGRLSVNCTEIYRTVRDTALANGHNITDAMAMGRAAFYACRKEENIR